MKKQIYLPIIALSLLFTSCINNQEHSPSLDPHLLEQNKASLLKSEPSPLFSNLSRIGEAILKQNDEEFKLKVYQHVEEQFDGDFNVLLTSLLSNSQIQKSANLGEAARMLDTFNEESEHPQIYIPFYEELKEQGILGKNEPILVINENDESVNEYPGYVLDDSGNLVQLDFLVSEQIATKKEVWVVGLNERVGHKDYISIDPKQNISENQKIQENWHGGHLYIESFMVPDLGAIESWISGKIELQVRAVSHLLGNIKSHYYGKIKRKYLKDKKWRSGNVFICDWNETVGPNIMIHWTELDGGSSTTTVTIPFPTMDGVPATSYSFTIAEDDDDLGYQLVQLSHSPSMLYNTGYIQWKMMSIY